MGGDDLSGSCEHVDAIVIGAGVVGLAIARQLALAGREVIILEKNARFGEETSSRNSEVIHAGIYYRSGSLRAQFCVAGKSLLYRYCDERGVSHAKCGKLIVATQPDEVAKLHILKNKGQSNGVDDLTVISAQDARVMEPALACRGALYSPSSGIVDSHGLMTALLGDAEHGGAIFTPNTPVLGGALGDDVVRLRTGGDQPMTVDARLVINAAGLGANALSRSIDGVNAQTVPPLYFGKGQYFRFRGKAPFQRLIYPAPGPDSLGIHYTRDLGGGAKLGPDIHYTERGDDYRVDAEAVDRFVAGARAFWPDLDPARLSPDYAGIRPRAKGPGEEGEFFIHGPDAFGGAPYIALYGMESPALTSCLAIAAYIESLLR